VLEGDYNAALGLENAGGSMLAAKVWATAAAAILVLAAHAGAQDWRGGQGHLEGRVVDASGQPVEGATVKLQLQKLAECKGDLKKVLELQPDGPKAETARKALAQLPK
jgi:hypothetical protein